MCGPIHEVACLPGSNRGLSSQALGSPEESRLDARMTGDIEARSMIPTYIRPRSGVIWMRFFIIPLADLMSNAASDREVKHHSIKSSLTLVFSLYVASHIHCLRKYSYPLSDVAPTVK